VDYRNYKFFDNSRFKLSGCVHFSHHVQCIVTALLYNKDFYLAFCPFCESSECRDSKDVTEYAKGQDTNW